MNMYTRLWLLAQKNRADRFMDQSTNFQQIQFGILKQYLKRSEKCFYGKLYRFSTLNNYIDFADRVPLSTYEDLEPYIQRMRQGEKDILFPGKPLFFETTSGSSGAVKYIPYNNALKNELSNAIAPWMWDLYRQDPKIFSGKFYWSISPPLKETLTPTQKDSAYFHPLQAFMLNKLFAVPENITAITDPHQFYLKTWTYLLNCKNLSFISCWSPLFLLRLFEFYEANHTEISLLSKGNKKHLVAGFDITHLFPHLRLVSCWTDAQSKLWLPSLKQYTRHIPIQGKGLLATEGVSSIPLGRKHKVLAYRSHFYEFMNTENKIFTADRLIAGETYELLITTGAGLWRYRTRDQVKYLGLHEGWPALEFIGRGIDLSDLAGEKLSQAFIIHIFIELLRSFPSVRALYLHPVIAGNEPYYELLIESAVSEDNVTAELLQLTEQQLKENPYYAQALALKQLLPLQVKNVGPDLTLRLIDYYRNKKRMKDGNIKIPVLLPPGIINEL